MPRTLTRRQAGLGHACQTGNMAIQERLLSKPDDNLTVEEHWTHVKTALTDACKEAIGFKTKRHQDWFNENDKEIKRLIESKRQAFTDWQTHRHCNTRKAKYHRLRADVAISRTSGGWIKLLRIRAMLTTTCLENSMLPPERSTDRHRDIPHPSDQRTVRP